MYLSLIKVTTFKSNTLGSYCASWCCVVGYHADKAHEFCRSDNWNIRWTIRSLVDLPYCNFSGTGWKERGKLNNNVQTPCFIHSPHLLIISVGSCEQTSSTPGASCTKLAYAQKSCVSNFSRKRSDVRRLTWREKVRFSTQTKCLAYAHFCCIVSWRHIEANQRNNMRPTRSRVKK